MAIYEFEGRVPNIDPTAYVSKEATIIGDVTIGPLCFIGPGARIKGDYGTIVVNRETSIQENCVLHARPGETCLIGSRVNVGHGAIIHGGKVDDGAVIGMGSIVSDFSHVGEKSIIAEGAVIKSGQIIEPRSIVVGIPGKVVGKVKPQIEEEYEHFKDIYVGLCKRYKTGLKKISD
jgi:phenylacetic acid degradation protein